MDGLFDDLIPAGAPKAQQSQGLFDDLIPEAPVEGSSEIRRQKMGGENQGAFDEGDNSSSKDGPGFADLIPKPTKEDHGIFHELGQGSMAGLRSIAESAKQSVQLAEGERPEAAAPVPADQQAMAAPFDVGTMPDKDTAGKVAYHLAQGLAGGLPEMAGALAGGAVGEALPVPGGALLGAGLGAGGIYAFRQIAPNFAAELQASPDDPNAAWSRAVKKTQVGGAMTAAGFAAFGLNPFEGELKNLAFQAFGLQPAIGQVQLAEQNKAAGKPVTEGAGSAYIESALGTVGPALAMRPFHGKGEAAAQPKPETDAESAKAAPEGAGSSGGEPPGGAGAFASPIPDFIKDAGATEENSQAIATGAEPAPKTFKIENPEAYGLDLSKMAPEQARTSLEAAQDTEVAAAQARAALADPAAVDPSIAARFPIPNIKGAEHDAVTDEPPARPAQRGAEDGIEPAPRAGGAGPGPEPGERGEERARPSPAIGEGVRSRAPAEGAQGNAAGGGRGAGTETAGAEPARVGEPVQPAAQAAIDTKAPIITRVGDLEPNDLSAFRKEASLGTGRKGVPVYFHGDGVAYDPLTRSLTVGENVPADAAPEVAKLAKASPPTAWRDANVKAFNDDGTTEEMKAGAAADDLSGRYRRALAVLECLA